MDPRMLLKKTISSEGIDLHANFTKVAITPKEMAAHIIVRTLFAVRSGVRIGRLV